MEQQERLVSLNEAADRIAVNARTLQDRKIPRAHWFGVGEDRATG